MPDSIIDLWSFGVFGPVFYCAYESSSIVVHESNSSCVRQKYATVEKDNNTLIFMSHTTARCIYNLKKHRSSSLKLTHLVVARDSRAAQMDVECVSDITATEPMESLRPGATEPYKLLHPKVPPRVP